MSQFEKPQLISEEKISEREELNEFVAAKTGVDSRPHKYRARYKVERWRGQYSDSSVAVREKRFLIANTLEDLGPVKDMEKATRTPILKKAA